MHRANRIPHGTIRYLRRGALAAALTLGLALGASAWAQSLATLLPDDVEAAVGVADLNGVADRLQPFLDEAERLDLLGALLQALGGTVGAPVDDADVMGAMLPPAYDELGPLDLLGSEAWIAVTTSPFDPLPSVTLLARTSAAAQEAFATAIAEQAGVAGTRVLEEAGRTFYTYVPEGGLLPDPERPGEDLGLPLAYAQLGDVLLLSTDPEVIRFALRAHGGSGEASFADLPAFAELQALGPGQVLGFLDPLPLTRSLESLAAGSGAGDLLTRVQRALATAGPSVGVLTFDDAGIAAVGRQTPDPAGGDARLYALLVNGSAPSTDLLRFAPAGAPSVSAGTADLVEWWTWLDDVLRSAAPLGLPTASEALELLDLSANELLLSWAGDGVAQIQTAPLTASEPAMADAPLLGEQVVLIRSRDDASAAAGLRAMFRTVGATLAGFLDPSGEGLAEPVSIDVAGTSVLRLELSDGLTLDAAVVDGWVMLSGSPAATEAVLAASASTEGGSSVLSGLAGEVPEGVRSWSLAAAPSGDATAADALVAQLQMLAGLGGASALDFDAVDRASEAISAFSAFVAERVGPSVAWTRIEDGSLVNRQRTYVSW